MWKIYDMVAVKGINFRVPILDVGTGLPLGGYVLGGISGTDFLVSALVLLLPSTRPSTQLGNLLRSAQKKQEIFQRKKGLAEGEGGRR
ncbi:hypothetical protein V6N12_076021 [Hibiscus sabdariffa]|uniref:Uncharacterized protein n=1 Tax=Hibiscus sabdariffa TaxID=183260 RepID=A0ABR2AZP7_9ROSI